MTAPAPVASELPALTLAAAAAGLTVRSCASWPETESDGPVAALAGYIDSNFSPLVAEVVGRVLHASDRAPVRPGRPPAQESGPVTAIVIVTALGDVTSATRVAAAVDAGERVAPLHFYQCVPNSVAGYLAARWHLSGPVACVNETAAGLAVAALLLADADADEAVVVRVDLAVDAGGRDRAVAILVTGQVPPERPATSGAGGEKAR